MPAVLAVRREDQPGVGTGGAAVGPGDAAGVEEAHSADHFVAWDVGVAM